MSRDSCRHQKGKASYQAKYMGSRMGMESLEKGSYGMAYQIINVRGHYEAYINGKFVCSGDTWNETVREVEKHLSAMR